MQHQVDMFRQQLRYEIMGIWRNWGSVVCLYLGIFYNAMHSPLKQKFHRHHF